MEVSSGRQAVLDKNGGNMLSYTALYEARIIQLFVWYFSPKQPMMMLN